MFCFRHIFSSMADSRPNGETYANNSMLTLSAFHLGHRQMQKLAIFRMGFSACMRHILVFTPSPPPSVKNDNCLESSWHRSAVRWQLLGIFYSSFFPFLFFVLSLLLYIIEVLLFCCFSFYLCTLKHLRNRGKDIIWTNRTFVVIFTTTFTIATFVFVIFITIFSIIIDNTSLLLQRLIYWSRSAFLYSATTSYFSSLF